MVRADFLALFGIVSLALVLRLWGIGFGLPYIYHFDEPTYVSAALNLGAGVIARQPNPTGLPNILFFEYVGYFILGRLVGLFASVTDFEQAYRSDPSIFFLLARLTSALLGTLNVLIIYRLGKELRDRWVGTLAALFLALSFLHVRDSHYGVPDIAVTSFTSLSILFCILAIRQPSRLYYSAAAVAGGFAVATKWSVGPLIIPLILTAFLYVPRGRKNIKRVLIPQILKMSMFFLGGFLVGGFQILLKPAVYLDYALDEWRAGALGGFNIWQIDTVPGWLFYLKTLNYGLGSILLGLAIVGFLRRSILAIKMQDKLSLVVLSFPLFYYLLMGSTRHYFARYALPLIPFMTVFAAEAVIDTVAKIRQPRWRQSIMVVLILAAVAQPLAYSVRHNMLLTRKDTRTLAKEWIEANIPSGAKIAVDWPVHGPPLSTPERKLPGTKRIYDVVIIGGTGRSGLPERPIQWYREHGFDYLITSSFISNIPLVYEEKNIERREFYASLAQEFELVKEFRPYTGDTELPFIFDEIYGPAISLWKRDRPGPTLTIYRVTP